MGRLQRQNISMALDGVSMPLFTKERGCTKEDAETILQEVRKDLDDLGKHSSVRV